MMSIDARDGVYRCHGIYIYIDFWHCLVCKSTVSHLDHDPTIDCGFESRLEALCVFFSSLFSDLLAAIARI